MADGGHVEDWLVFFLPVSVFLLTVIFGILSLVYAGEEEQSSSTSNKDTPVGLSFDVSWKGNHEFSQEVPVILKPGKLTLLVGESGCGKTTLMEAIGGFKSKQLHGSLHLLPNTGGWIKCLDHVAVRRRNISVLHQEEELSYWRCWPVIDALLFSVRAFNFSFSRQDAKNSLLEVGIDESRFNNMVMHLSGGQIRRFRLAKILAINKPILLADEVTTGLDRKIAYDIMKLIKDIAMKRRISILAAVHQAGTEIYKLVDNFITLERITTSQTSLTSFTGDYGSLRKCNSLMRSESVFLGRRKSVAKVVADAIREGIDPLLQSDEPDVDAILPLDVSDEPDVNIQLEEPSKIGFIQSFLFYIRRILFHAAFSEYETKLHWGNTVFEVFMGILVGLFFYDPFDPPAMVMSLGLLASLGLLNQFYVCFFIYTQVSLIREEHITQSNLNSNAAIFSTMLMSTSFQAITAIILSTAAQFCVPSYWLGSFSVLNFILLSHMTSLSSILGAIKGETISELMPNAMMLNISSFILSGIMIPFQHCGIIVFQYFRFINPLWWYLQCFLGILDDSIPSHHEYPCLEDQKCRFADLEQAMKYFGLDEYNSCYESIGVSFAIASVIAIWGCIKLSKLAHTVEYREEVVISKPDNLNDTNERSHNNGLRSAFRRCQSYVPTIVIIPWWLNLIVILTCIFFFGPYCIWFGERHDITITVTGIVVMLINCFRIYSQYQLFLSSKLTKLYSGTSEWIDVALTFMNILIIVPIYALKAFEHDNLLLFVFFIDIVFIELINFPFLCPQSTHNESENGYE